jgi:hypothetical protein
VTDEEQIILFGDPDAPKPRGVIFVHPEPAVQVIRCDLALAALAVAEWQAANPIEAGVGNRKARRAQESEVARRLRRERRRARRLTVTVG